MSAGFSVELVQIMASRTGPAPICLLDVVRLDGVAYHWADSEIDVTPVYSGTEPSWATQLANPPANYNSHYFPWLLSASGFHQSRSIVSDSATIEVQNVSGNTVQRDLASQVTASAFEGALYAFREWNPLKEEAEFEQHGRLTLISFGELTCGFAAGQRFNSNDIDGNPYEYSETCQWRYASPGCGDTTNNPCDNTYATCRQQNRFLGVLNNVVFPKSASVANISANAVERRRFV